MAYKLEDGSSSNTKMEDDGIEYLSTLLKAKFNVKLTDEGCLSDFVVKPNDITEDRWLQIQLKTTQKPSDCNYGGYKFTFNNTVYNDHLIICLCTNHKKIWIFDGNLQQTDINIGRYQSKYDSNRIDIENLCEKVNEFYNKSYQFGFDKINIPISDNCKKEQEFKKHRELLCNFITFDYPVRRQLVYDFMINNKKIQEKTGFIIRNNEFNIQFKLVKNNGTSFYEKGDNDFYWLNCPDKDHFLIIPEDLIIGKKILRIILNKNLKSWYKSFIYKYSQLDEQQIINIFS